MKRILLILSLVFVLVLSACVADDADDADETNGDESGSGSETENGTENKIDDEEAELFFEMENAVRKVTTLRLDYIVPLKSIVTGEDEYMYCKLKGRGYAVVDLDSMQISESTEAKGGEPNIELDTDTDYYYAGVMQFWYGGGDDYYDLATNEKIDEETLAGARNIMDEVWGE